LNSPAICYRSSLTGKGPIVRIGPSEVHIADAFFHSNFEKNYRGVRKDPWIYNVGLNGATGVLVEERRHRNHRAALGSAFNEKFAKEIPHLITMYVKQLMEQLIHRTKASSKEQGLVNISDVFRSLSRDVISSIFVGEREGLLNRPDLGHSALETYRGLFQCAAWHRQFHFLGPLVKSLPLWIVTHILPHLRSERVGKRTASN
jgi:hypothetical protein